MEWCSIECPIGFPHAHCFVCGVPTFGPDRCEVHRGRIMVLPLVPVRDWDLRLLSYGHVAVPDGDGGVKSESDVRRDRKRFGEWF